MSDFDITKYKPEELQLRNGWAVEAVFTQGSICYVVARDEVKAIQAGHRKKNGWMFNNIQSDFDVILKHIPKKLIAPYYRWDSNYPDSMTLSDIFLTKEEAQKQKCFIKWCEVLAIEVNE